MTPGVCANRSAMRCKNACQACWSTRDGHHSHCFCRLAADARRFPADRHLTPILDQHHADPARLHSGHRPRHLDHREALSGTGRRRGRIRMARLLQTRHRLPDAARIAVAELAGLDSRKELLNQAVEQRGFLEVDRVARLREDRKP